MDKFTASQAREVVKKHEALKKMPEIYKMIKARAALGMTQIQFTPSFLKEEHVDILKEDGYDVITTRENEDCFNSGSIVEYTVDWRK